MNQNSVVSLQIHSYTFIASFTNSILRITLQVNHNDETIFVSQKFSEEYFPQELQIIFEDVRGFYQYLYKIAIKNMADRIIFKNQLLVIKVLIDDKIREIPIKMRKMRQEKQNKFADNQFMLTSIASQIQQSRLSKQSRVTSNNDKLYPGPRLKLMMLKQGSKMKKAMTKIPQYSSNSITKTIKQYPYTKLQTLPTHNNRYDKYNTENVVQNGRKSYSEEKVQFSRSHSLTLKKNVRQNNLDLSNKELKFHDVKEIVNYDWSKLILLNLGYNNIGTQGLKLLTSIKWPILKTLYVCFNNINKVEWNPGNICFVKTLSLSGNKIRQIPKNIIELQFLQELFIYNNKIQIIPEELIVMEELKNLSIYGNKLDMARCKKIIAKLKSKKVQVWE